MVTDLRPLLNEFAGMPLDPGQAACLFLERSGVLLRTLQATVAIDIANYVTPEAMETLDLHALLYTHIHSDHYHRESAAGLFTATGSPIVAQPDVAKQLEADVPADKLYVGVLDSIHTFCAIKIATVGVWTSVPPQSLYRIEIGELTAFHGGDVGYLALKLAPPDIAFLATEGIAPTREEAPLYANRMVRELKPRVVFGIHGTAAHNRTFRNLVREHVPQTRVMTPDPYSLHKLGLEAEDRGIR